MNEYIHVTNHALVRWLERTGLLDENLGFNPDTDHPRLIISYLAHQYPKAIPNARQRIVNETRPAIEMGAMFMTCTDGYRYILNPQRRAVISYVPPGWSRAKH